MGLWSLRGRVHATRSDYSRTENTLPNTPAGLSPRARRGLMVFVLLLAGGTGPSVVTGQVGCDTIVRPRLLNSPSAPPDTTGRGSDYWRWSHAHERTTTGVGVLSPGYSPGDEPPGADWLPRVSLPLYPAPGAAEPTAWIHRGWWVVPEDRERDRAMGYRGMMETEYEQASLVVTEVRDDGWLHVWVDIGPVGRAATHGAMWTHSCLLDLGPIPLTLTLWEDRFVGEGAPALSFLGDARHALRSSAGLDGSLIVWLERDDEVEILEIAGDWARVRAFIPGVYLAGCLGEEWAGEAREGWVRWRDPAAGTWLWYPTRGC